MNWSVFAGLRRWLNTRTKNPSPSPFESEAAARARSAPRATVVIPALNEERRIGEVVRYARADPACAEVIVVDDSSLDETVVRARDAGAKVITSTMLGKGASMEDGIRAAANEIIVYLDGDLAGLEPGIITKLAEPIATNQFDMVKAAFGRGGGRVTELTAKPMLKMFFPELSRFAQPLGGIMSARKSLLSALSFESGYGVDIGLLIDAHTHGARVGEVDIGSLEHESQPLANLALMAQEISRVVLDRRGNQSRLSVDHILSVFEMERQNQTDIDGVLTKLNGVRKLALFDMDGTVTRQRFVVELAKATQRSDALAELLRIDDDTTRSDEIAALFRFIPKATFEHVARTIELREDAVATVNQLRRAGYSVGVISDSYFVATEIIRRRIFANFAVAHTLEFDRDVCAGRLRLNRAFTRADGCQKHAVCKSNVMRYLSAAVGSTQLEHTLAIGDNYNDLCLLQLVDRGLTIEPKHPALLQSANIFEIESLNAALAFIHPKADGATAAADGATINS